MMYDIVNGVILNNTTINNKDVNEQFNIANKGHQKKSLFDLFPEDGNPVMDEWLINERLTNPDELVEYDAKNLWLNFWYMMQSPPWQVTVAPEELEDHYWFKDKLFTYASHYKTCNFMFFTRKDIVDSVCERCPAGNEDRIRFELSQQIKLRKYIEKFQFSQIVYHEGGLVDDDLRQKVLNIYNEIQ